VPGYRFLSGVVPAFSRPELGVNDNVFIFTGWNGELDELFVQHRERSGRNSS
jgi:hypothetical protein